MTFSDLFLAGFKIDFKGSVLVVDQDVCPRFWSFFQRINRPAS